MTRSKQQYDVRLRCAYPEGDCTQHRQFQKLKDIPKWIEAYKFTNPNCKSISVKIWFDDIEN